MTAGYRSYDVGARQPNTCLPFSGPIRLSGSVRKGGQRRARGLCRRCGHRAASRAPVQLSGAAGGVLPACVRGRADRRIVRMALCVDHRPVRGFARDTSDLLRPRTLAVRCADRSDRPAPRMMRTSEAGRQPFIPRAQTPGRLGSSTSTRLRRARWTTGAHRRNRAPRDPDSFVCFAR
jgi:hypothetical protein